MRKRSDWYNLDLGTEAKLSEDTWVLRVPGGWVVNILREDVAVAACFVPDPEQTYSVSALTSPADSC